MKKLTLVVVALLAFGGCKKKGTEGAAPALAKMGELRDEMCKCKDSACAKDVSDRMTKWAAEQPKDQQKKMSEADAQKAKAIGEELTKCMQTVAAVAPPPPPAGSATPPAG